MVRVEYRGPARGVYELAQLLNAEGLADVRYDAPVERRSGGLEQVAIVTVLYVGDKVADAVIGESVGSLSKKAVARFKGRHKDAPFEVEVIEDE